MIGVIEACYRIYRFVGKVRGRLGQVNRDAVEVEAGNLIDLRAEVAAREEEEEGESPPSQSNINDLQPIFTIPLTQFHPTNPFRQ